MFFATFPVSNKYNLQNLLKHEMVYSYEVS